MLELPTKHPLWLVEYRETGDDEFGLSITLIEAKTAAEPMDTELGQAYPVRPEPSSSVFSIRWSDYVAFAVRNERFALPEEGAPLGYGLGIKQQSLLLVYVAASTFANDDYPGPLTHWYLNTEWHCFDIISTSAPEIRRLSPEPAQEILNKYL